MSMLAIHPDGTERAFDPKLPYHLAHPDVDVETRQKIARVLRVQVLTSEFMPPPFEISERIRVMRSALELDRANRAAGDAIDPAMGALVDQELAEYRVYSDPVDQDRAIHLGGEPSAETPRGVLNAPSKRPAWTPSSGYVLAGLGTDPAGPAIRQAQDGRLYAQGEKGQLVEVFRDPSGEEGRYVRASRMTKKERRRLRRSTRGARVDQDRGAPTA